MDNKRFPVRRFIAGAVLSLVFAGILNPAFAERTLDSLKNPLQVRLDTDLNGESAQYGDKFEATLTEAYKYQELLLPAGTKFKGQVQTVRKSYPFAMPGYLSLEVREAILPGGEMYNFAEKKFEAPNKKLRHPEAKTPKKLLQSSLPFSAVSAADSIPLKYAAGMSTWQILPISIAARMATGVVLELAVKDEKEKHHAKGHPMPTRVGHGMLRGSGLTGAYYFLTPSLEPKFSAGEDILLHFNPDGLASLFEASQAQSNVYGAIREASR